MAERLENCLKEVLDENASAVKTRCTSNGTKRPQKLYYSLVLALEF